MKQKSPPPKEKKYLSREQIADLGQEKINIPLLRNKPKKKEEEKIKNNKESMAKNLSNYTRNSLLQIAKDNGIPQKNSETKQNLLERLYQLDPTKILWNNYEKLKRQPKNK